MTRNEAGKFVGNSVDKITKTVAGQTFSLFDALAGVLVYGSILRTFLQDDPTYFDMMASAARDATKLTVATVRLDRLGTPN